MKYLFLLGWFVSAVIYGAETLSLSIGVSPDNPPLSMQSDKNNHFFGFEIELMNELCNGILAKCQYKPVIVSKVLSELISGDIDLAIAAIIHPSAPLDGFIFSLPYLASGAEFMVLKESKINTLEEIINKTVGVRRGTLGNGRLFEDMILLKYNNKITVIEYITTEDLFQALNNKDIDAIFTNTPVVNYWYYNNMELYKIIGSNIPVEDGYAIISVPKFALVIEQINQELRKIIADGTYLKIYSTYFSQITPK